MNWPTINRLWQFAAEHQRKRDLGFGTAGFVTYIQGVAGNWALDLLLQRLLRDTLPLLRGSFFCRTGPVFFGAHAARLPAITFIHNTPAPRSGLLGARSA